jgi:mannitol-1-phosphate/altronate dehydrogenase
MREQRRTSNKHLKKKYNNNKNTVDFNVTAHGANVHSANSQKATSAVINDFSMRNCVSFLSPFFAAFM